jgi:cell division protein FtsI (penicillin-binding protein 3)
MDKTLKGKSGRTIFEQSQDGRPIPNARQETISPVPGREVQLTIDSDLQWFAQNAVAQKVIQTQALSGTVVVENVKTGELLAVASYPTFDPNQPGQSSENWTNKAFNDVYEPGSTGKVMTAAAALEEGVVTPSDVVEVPNRIHRAGTEFKDSHDHPTEYLTFAGVLAQSSNIGTILAGEKVKPSTMYSYFTKFGLGRTSGMGFPGEGPGLLTNVKDWNGSQRYTVLFGQGLSVNALQAAGVFQTIANNGVRIPPRIVAATGDGKGGLTPAPKPEPVKVVSPDTAKQVRDMLEGVVTKEGTAPEAKIAGYRVAGKTGTADRYDAKVGHYSGKTASFIGFAPADDPEIVVAVTLQRPIKGYFGGVVAGPVFHDVMTYALQELQIPPTGTSSPVTKIRPDKVPAASDPSVIRDRRSGSSGASP